MNLLNRLLEPYLEELKKVEWSTWEELQTNAVTILVASLLIALIIAVMDFAFQNLMRFVYSLMY
jgi:preprotein translocase subunit SecE